MLNFLLDIAPDKSQLLLTIKLAGIFGKRNKRYTIPTPQTLLLRLYYMIKE